MAKFYGKIGYATTVESVPGVWVEEITTRNYYGDILTNYSRRNSSDKVNDNITISNKISIVADPFAIENFIYMRYAEFMGIKWKIENVEVNRPRLILTLGGEYNGEQT